MTKAMTKKAKLNHGMQDIDLTDTLIGQSFNDEILDSLSSSQSECLTFTLQGQTLTFHLQFQMIKVMLQFAKKNTVTPRSHLYLKGL